jgi:tetratricopeptide (TPR) repeat protein
MKLFGIVLTLLGLTIFYSCTNEHGNKTMSPSKECVKLNNEGAKLIMDYNGAGDTSINLAIDLFKQAIKCDSTYSLAYLNLADAYDKSGKYKDELFSLNKSLKINNNPSVLILKVRLFVKTNELDSARKVFKLANKKLEESITNHNSNLSAIKELILLKAIMYGRDEALKEIDKQMQMHPEFSIQLKDEYDFYKDFDKDSFINGTPKVTSN